MSFDIEKYYKELEIETTHRNNLVQFYLGIIAFLSSWIGFHFFDWHVIGAGLLLFLGVVMFLTGGCDYVKGLQKNQKVNT